MNFALHHYSKRVYSGVLFAGGLSIQPFALVHWLAGEIRLAVLIAALVGSIWLLATWSLKSRDMAATPLMMMTVLCDAICLILLVNLRETGIFWFYPLMMAIAFVMPWRWSVPLNAANVAAALLFATAWMPGALYLRLVATMLVALFFAALFSYNMTKYQEQLHDLVVHDPLTGAYNRRYFTRMLDEIRRNWKRTGRAASLLILDIDHFKQVNDRHGHGVGDMALIELTRHITVQLRASDRFFRLGGEEFAILLPETPADQGVLLADRLRQQISSGPLKEGLPTFTISCGVADYPEPDSLTEWPEQCDAALYAAKAAGRNRVVLAGRHTAMPA